MTSRYTFVPKKLKFNFFIYTNDCKDRPLSIYNKKYSTVRCRSKCDADQLPPTRPLYPLPVRC